MDELAVPKQPQYQVTDRDATLLRVVSRRLERQGTSALTIRHLRRTALRHGTLDGILGIATRRILTRGASHGRRPLLTIGVALIGFRIIRRMARPGTRVVWRARLDPGDAIQLRGVAQR